MDMELATLLKTAQEEGEKAKTEAREKAAREEKNEKDTEKLVKEATKKPEEWIKKVEKAREAIVCFSALLENKLDEAKKHLGAVEDDKYTCYHHANGNAILFPFYAHAKGGI